jgi:putative protein-disulfide isomerase
MNELVYVLDPMCSWCWAFRPSWDALLGVIPDETRVRYVMGGLAPDSNDPMPIPMREYLKSAWATIEQRTGARFNFEFWDKNEARRSTYPACRAVIAAGRQQSAAVPGMIAGIQKAYYLDARNPADTQTLYDVAQAIGLDRERFVTDLGSSAVQADLDQDLETTRRLGVQGFPSVLVHHHGQYQALARGWCDPDTLTRRWQEYQGRGRTPARPG